MLSKCNVTVPIACKIRLVKIFDLGSRCELRNLDGHAGYSCSRAVWRAGKPATGRSGLDRGDLRPRQIVEGIEKMPVEKPEHKPNRSLILAS